MSRRFLVFIIFCGLFLSHGVYAGSYSCSGISCSDNAQAATKQFYAAERFYSSGDYDDALAAYQTAVILDYRKCYCNKKIVDIYLRENKATLALTWSRSAVTSCGDHDSELLKLQADAYAALNRNDEAATAYDQASGGSSYYRQKSPAYTPSSTFVSYSANSANQPGSAETNSGSSYEGQNLENDPIRPILIDLVLGALFVWLLYRILEIRKRLTNDHNFRDEPQTDWDELKKHAGIHIGFAVIKCSIDYILQKLFGHAAEYYITIMIEFFVGILLLYFLSPTISFLLSLLH
jgi:tetratricopeptide (TPR) repeat protein